jgi:hypothetical protein
MPLDFPTSPTNGQAYNGYVYSTAIGAWQAKPSAQSPFYTGDTPPGNPVVGDSWFNTNDGTMYVYYNDGNTSQWVEHRSEIARSQVGLVPIVPSSIAVGSGTATVSGTGAVSFNAITSVSLNNVFSSSYRNYRMTLSVPVSSALTSVAIRFRTGTTDNSANSYFQYWTIKRITGATQDNTGGPSTSYALMSKSSTYSYGVWSGDIMSPNISNQATTANGIAMSADGTGSYNLINTVLFDPNTSFDGITIISTSGTITGAVSVYGYN